MAHIQIAFAGVSSANQILRKAARELAQMEDKYALLTGGVDPEIQSRYQIGKRLRLCQRAAKDSYFSANGVLEVARAGLLEYRMTEARLNRTVPADDEIFEMR